MQKDQSYPLEVIFHNRFEIDIRLGQQIIDIQLDIIIILSSLIFQQVLTSLQAGCPLIDFALLQFIL